MSTMLNNILPCRLLLGNPFHRQRAANFFLRSCNHSSASSCKAKVRVFSNSATMDKKVITMENLNPQVIKMEYAVRGPLVIRATALEKELLAVS